MSSGSTSMIGHIVPINIEDEIRESYLAYAMSVIVGRALPDARDGLKPVHRRILYAMYEMKVSWNRSYKKSARVVGDVIGKYHPHGDSAVYDALVRLAQEFNMRLPLVDGQGNFGSVDGDPPAAMRYTEVRMARACTEMLADLDKDTVDFAPNYDGSESEPLVLPAKIPNLLVNGSNGIAVGMSTNIPPHNLNEVMTAVIALMENPALSIDELIQMVPGPDFPTAGLIYGRAGIHSAYRTGRGIIKIRALAEVEQTKRGDEQIIVTELPYQVNKARLLEKIAQLVRDKKIEGIRELRDESDRTGMRVVIELKRDVQGEIVLNQLYAHTNLQTSWGIIMLAIVAGQPVLLTLKDALSHFIDFRRDVVVRRCLFELRKCRAREHILEGLKIALDHIDEIIRLIRASDSPVEAKEGLILRFALSDVQSQAILDMRLQKLTGLERDKILEELQLIRTDIARLEEILADRQVLDNVIIEELKEVRALFSDERRSQIVADLGAIGIEDLIAQEDMVVTISRENYIKRVALSEYEAQRRGGRGKMGMTTKDDDFVKDLFVADTHTRLLVFTSAGRVFALKVYELPAGSRTTKGRPIINLLPRLDAEEDIAAVLPVRNELVHDEVYLMTVTRKGIVKKTLLEAYANINVAGLRAVGIRENDKLIAAQLVSPNQSVLLVTVQGKSIHFKESDVRSMGRTASGVTGIRLAPGDGVMDVCIIRNPDAQILAVTERGFGKRTPASEYRIQNRGGKGIIAIKTGGRNGMVAGVRHVSEDDQIILITDAGTLLRTRISEIRETSRNTLGVTLIRLGEDEKLVALARVVEVDLDEDEEALPDDLALIAPDDAAPADPSVDAAPAEATVDAAAVQAFAEMAVEAAANDPVSPPEAAVPAAEVPETEPDA